MQHDESSPFPGLLVAPKRLRARPAAMVERPCPRPSPCFFQAFRKRPGVPNPPQPETDTGAQSDTRFITGVHIDANSLGQKRVVRAERDHLAR